MSLVRIINSNELVSYPIRLQKLYRKWQVNLPSQNVRYSVKLPSPTGVTEVVSQVTSYSKAFEPGSLHPIRGKTTISPVDRDTLERQHGSPKAAPSLNGNPPVQVHFYGFMGNVSPPTLTFSQILMVFAGQRERARAFSGMLFL